jgi:hypothetical protein
MKKMTLNQMEMVEGVIDLNRYEIINITAGDVGYYGKGPSLANMQANGKALAHFAGEVAHNVGDFFRGFFGL